MTAAAYGSRISARHARLSGTTEVCSDPNFKQQIHVRVLAARSARALRFVFPQTGGNREGRMRAASAVSCAKGTKEYAHEHTGSAEAIRHSLRNGFTAYIALSPENRALFYPAFADSWLIPARSGRLVFLR